MPNIEQYIDNTISDTLVKQNEEKRKEHKSSGKLSAGMLNQPLQWQILKALGAETKPVDAYTLRKFLRGNQVEDWFISMIPDIVETQKFCEYRDVVGYADIVMDTKNCDFPMGVIPHEVKSVNNLKYGRILKTGADKGHQLQACLYALGMGTDHFAIDYIATDDYRLKTYVFETKDFKPEIDEIIDRYDKQLASGVIPKFESREKWQENALYCQYPEFMGLTEEELKVKYNQLK